MKIILECDVGSIVFICCIFGYDMLLALVAFIFAFIARKLEDHCRSAGRSVCVSGVQLRVMGCRPSRKNCELGWACL